ncbi:MAG: Rieske 2Fe-2S domain-containing protein [Myxococcales bacterium]|nr:Rieske 2Fe-2S domain-containing protein [Myxococcales bacterium]
MHRQLSRRHALATVICAACARCAPFARVSHDGSAPRDATRDDERSSLDDGTTDSSSVDARDAFDLDARDASADRSSDDSNTPLLDATDREASLECPRGIAVGAASAVAVGARRILAVERLIVARDARGLFSMSATCTHSGCLVELDDAGYLCPCHSSRFGDDGAVANGPATQPLAHYALCVRSDGTLVVDVFTQVPPATRVP